MIILGKLNSSKTALTLGFLFSGVHLGWSALVLLGLAQPLLDFVFWAHMIESPFRVTGFNIVQAAVLIAVTFFVGYVVGWVFSKIWNTIQK